MSKILVIDTATEHIFLSLLIDGIEKQNIYQIGINNHSVTIIPLLKEILDKEKLTLQNLDEVIVGIGPGSYTGVRIGVTVAKMIGYLNSVKVSSVSSLALIASASTSDCVVPYVDARRGNAFIATFSQKAGILICEKEETLANVEEYKTHLQTGYDLICEGVPNVSKIINSKLTKEVNDIHELTPNYLRITEAERNKHGNKN